MLNTKRRDILADYHLLDSPKSYFFDSLTKLAAQLSNSSIAMISFFTEEKQWVKSNYGIEAGIENVSFEDSICIDLVNGTEYHLEVLDLTKDPKFSQNKFVKEGIVKYYLGFPLTDREGNRLGCFCVADKNPRDTAMPDLIKDQIQVLVNQAMVLVESNRLHKEMEMSQQRLLESSRASIINEMTRSVAHEINNPLTVLRTAVEVMQQMKSKDFNIVKLLDKMNSSVSHIQKVVLAMKENNIVNDNLFGDINEVIVASFEIVSRKFAVQKVSFYLEDDIAKDYKKYKVSKALQQVVFHLLQNAAFSATKNPGATMCVKMSMRLVNESIMIRVEDSGLGVAEEKIPTLFNGIFHSNYKGQAVGIGLNTCKRIVESVNGSIRFVKNSPTTFEVTAPLKLS